MSKFKGLQLVWLEAFVQVAESGKRSAAAEEMKIHQGTVTKHVQKLERWLGRCLLVDDSVPAKLSSDGQKFLPVARQILELLDEARWLAAPIEAAPAPRGSVKDLRVPYRGPIPKIR